MPILTVKNRFAEEPFIGMFDGVEYVVKDTLSVPDYVAHHLKRQSVVRDNPITGDNDYRLAIVELNEDDTPLEKLPLETFDRSDTEYPKAKVVPSNIRQYRPAPREATGAHAASSQTVR